MTTPLIDTETLLTSSLRRFGFVGEVAEPGSAGYDDARFGWNGAIDRLPSAIAHARDADDVSAAIRAARAAGTPFTVRAGGHSVSGRSVRDGALLIDLRGLNSVAVDRDTATVRVGGGALLSELDAATQEHGLAVPGGQISHTGVGGLTLGGGLGWLMRKHGLTIDSLLEAEVVLSDGSIVRASNGANPDLFWALRGGGGEFGAVTEFVFKAYPVGPTVLAGMLAYPVEDAPDAFRAGRELMATAPDELGQFQVLMTAPFGPPFPAELQGRQLGLISVAWCGDVEEGERVLAPLRQECPPALDLVAPMPYVALQSMLDPTAPHGWRYYDRLEYMQSLSDELTEVLVDQLAAAPTPQSHIICGFLGGAVSRVPTHETAYVHRSVGAEVWFIGCAGDEPIGPTQAWVRGATDAVAPFATGATYVNALEAGGATGSAYDDATMERLRSVKRRYDPDAAFSPLGL